MTALVIGEALVDVVESATGRESHPGGSPANVALGLARLGRPVELATRLADDDAGRTVVAHLAASGVTLAAGSLCAARTSVATARLDAAGVATYEFDLTWDWPGGNPSDLGDPLVVHTGSIAAVLEPGATAVAGAVAALRPTATVTYDPNLRPSLMPPPEVTRPVVEGLVALADVVKVSDEDLAWLAPGEDPLDVLRRWLTTGPAVAVLTRGGEGATALTRDGRRLDVVAPRVEVADTVGAGDSFMGGLIDGLWSAGLLGADRRDALRAVGDETLMRVLERSARIAAITVSRPGANPPTSQELA